MKLGEKLVLDSSLTNKNMTFLKQVGASYLTVALVEMLTEEPTGKSALSRVRHGEYFETEDLVALRKWVESRGFELSAIASPPFLHWEKIMLGQPGRDEQIENWNKSLRNMGKAGIPQLQYSWVLNAGAWIPLWRTSAENMGRGGTRIVRFDYEVARKAPVTDYGEISEETMWDNLTYFLKAVIPVAEEAGVAMAMHPCDPQVPSIAGVARIVRSIEAYDRVFKIMPSKSNCMIFCLGCFAQMLDVDGVYRAMRHFGRQGRIGYVHFRGVRGTLEKFDEVFPDEGDLDMVKAVKVLKEAGYNGIVQPDHAPHTTGDTKYGHISHAFQIGYLKGLLQGVSALG
ncbi:mannonate dehydratase [Chloroflexota bacterium]